MSTGPHHHLDEPPAGSAVLAGVDGREGSARVLQAAARLARAFDLPVVVALVQPYCSDVVPTGAMASLELQHEIEEAVFLTAATVLDGAGVRWRFGLAHGGAAQGLRALADACDAAVVVVGTRGDGPRSRLHRLFSGSVSGRLVHGQHRPVLVVPPDPTPRPSRRLHPQP